MKLIWTKKISSESPWEPNYSGYFYVSERSISFIYEDGHNICSATPNSDFPKRILSSAPGCTLPLPYMWTYIASAACQYLFVGQDIAIDLTIPALAKTVPIDVLEEYKRMLRPRGYFETASFTFGDYIISHKGQYGYVCARNGTPCWEYMGQAYLYTEILRWKNRIFFGTAGKGGYFFILDITNGKEIAKIKTGGTASIVQIDNLCYFLRNDYSAKLLCIDIQDGKIIQEISLPGKSSVESRIQLVNNQIHAITFEYKKGRLENALWNCIAL